MGLTLLVLAAGMGSRYGGLKQVEGFGPSGETLLEYSLYDARRAGFDRFVFVIRKALQNDFEKHILSRLPSDFSVELCFQELEDLPHPFRPPAGRVKPWGTGHAVWVARNHLSDPFALVNADDFYGKNGFARIAKHFTEGDAASRTHLLVGYPVHQTLSSTGTVSRGLCKRHDNGRLKGLVEVASIREQSGRIVGRLNNEDVHIEPDALVSMNLFGFDPSMIQHLDQELTEFLNHQGEALQSECYIPSVVDRMLRDDPNSVDLIGTEDRWMGVTNPEDKAMVIEGLANLVSQGVYPVSLWSE